MQPNTQSILENEKVILYPLQDKDFDALYRVASDPEIWEQHPEKDRWKKHIFRNFFDAAIQSKGAFKIADKPTGNIIGSTRIYDYNDHGNSIFIGYTFYAVSCWGTGINQSVKTMMLDYLFQSVSKVCFHIGAENIRSQIAISRLGAEKSTEQKATYSGEAARLNYVYEISKNNWDKRQTK